MNVSTVASRTQNRLRSRIVVVGALIIALLLWVSLDLSLGRTTVEWIPYLASGFLMNIVISLLAMTIGTAFGVLLGVLQLTPFRLVRYLVVTYVQIFRNAPHLVLMWEASKSSNGLKALRT
ncbi:ABC transporter permease subunit [Rhizobium sp. HT1-10]